MRCGGEADWRGSLSLDRKIAHGRCGGNTETPCLIGPKQQLRSPRDWQNQCRVIRVTGVWNIGPLQPLQFHCGLMPANLITLPHFSVSSTISLPNWAGDPG